MAGGSCLCGAVSFSVAAFSSGVFKCHCSKCRKAFGGASSAAVLAPASAFAWTSDAPAGEYRTDSGFLRRFCARCGSILPQELPDYGQVWIPAGLLEGDPGLTLKRHIHVASQAPWEVLDDVTPRHPEGFDS